MTRHLLLSALLLCCYSPVYGVTLNADFTDGRWNAVQLGVGPTMTAVGGRADIVFPASSQSDANGYLTAYYESTFCVHGDFTVDMGYDLTTWPPGNGVTHTRAATHPR
jgi:hypothetical protein